MHEIAYCCTVKNRIDNLLRLVESLSKLANPGPFELVLGDYQSTDANLVKKLAGLTFPVTIVTIKKAKFNRSQGLNVAAAHFHDEPPSRLFFIDTDMIVPQDFNRRLRLNVVAGKCWFPICYSLHKGKSAIVLSDSKFPGKANGWWRKTGRGMLGITRDDFNKIGRWNESIGVSYGNEDGDISTRLARSSMLVRRDKCNGLFHVWHPTNGRFRTRYHSAQGLSGNVRRACFSSPAAPKIAIHRLPAGCRK